MDLGDLFRQAAASMEAELRATETARRLARRLTWTADAARTFSAGPWFVDASGRRARTLSRAEMVEFWLVINRAKALGIHVDEALEDLLTAFEDL